MRTHTQHQTPRIPIQYEQGGKTSFSRPQMTSEGSMYVSEAISAEIEAYVRSGALDAVECLQIATDQLARKFKLTFRQAETLMNLHTR